LLKSIDLIHEVFYVKSFMFFVNTVVKAKKSYNGTNRKYR
jgi:hypothetical protein